MSISRFLHRFRQRRRSPYDPYYDPNVEYYDEDDEDDPDVPTEMPIVREKTVPVLSILRKQPSSEGMTSEHESEGEEDMAKEDDVKVVRYDKED